MPRAEGATEAGQAAGVRGRLLPLALALGVVAIGIACVGYAVAGIVRDRPESVAYADSGFQSEAASSWAGSAPQPKPVVRAASGKRPAAATFAPQHGPQPRPALGERFGILAIPALKRTLTIVEGTGAAELEKGVGHFSGSVMPGIANNCVLSGHRDTVFTGLGDVKIGDPLIVWTSAGVFTYKVRRIRIVHKDDRTVIVPTDHAVLTVTTCYPFAYIGSAPDRYILIADLVASR